MFTSRGQSWPQAFHENLVQASSVSDLESAAVSGRPVPFGCRNFLGLRTINKVTVGEQVGFKISVFGNFALALYEQYAHVRRFQRGHGPTLHVWRHSQNTSFFALAV